MNELPSAAAVPALMAALNEGAAVVQEPPGTGKTTLAPPAVARWLEEHGRPGRVVVTQPRRVVARAAARRVAELDGTRLGDVVGYSVRGESRTSAATRIEFVTPGLLNRRLLAAPELGGIGAVILDEVHERSLESDVALALLADVRTLRGDLVVVAMSATLDAPRFAEILAATTASGDAPLVDCPSALHPLDVRWAPPSTPRLDERGVTHAFLDHVAQTTRHALDATGSHSSTTPPDADTLVFLPGVREVSEVAGRLRAACPDLDVLELHGRIDAAEQDRATPGARRVSRVASSSRRRSPSPRSPCRACASSSTRGSPGNHDATSPVA